jgi:hypothetical protein
LSIYDCQAVVLMTSPTGNPGMGIMSYFLVVRRMALATIHGGQRFMILRNRPGVALQTRDITVQ